MSGNPTVSEWFQTEYVTGVQHVFQHQGHLYGKFCRRKVISNATEAEFHQYGFLTAGPKVAGKIPRQKGDHKKVKVGTEENFVGVEIEQYDLDQMAEDDRDAAKQAAGLAIARKADEIFRTAIALTDTAAIGGAGEFMSPALSEEINRYFVNKFVMPMHPVVVTLPAMGFSQLMRFKEFAASEYTGPSLPWTSDNAIMAKSWNGKHWICDPLLTQTGDLVRCFAWTPTSIAEVQLTDVRVIWSWMNDENNWFGNHNFRQGNKILPAMKTGILPFDIDVSILPEQIDPETYEVAV